MAGFLQQGSCTLSCCQSSSTLALSTGTVRSGSVSSVGEDVYVNQRWFPPLSCRRVQYSRHIVGITVFADFWFLIRGFSGKMSLIYTTI